MRPGRESGVQPATAGDAAAIAAVHAAGAREAYSGVLPEDVLGVGAREEQWRGWIGRAHATTVVARVEGAVVGFCALHSSPGEASPQKRGEIPALFVLPTYWRRGWGRRLCERALDEARASGMEDVGLWVLESNTRARSFYEALGFRLSDETRVFLERGSAELLERRYVKDLREA